MKSRIYKQPTQRFWFFSSWLTRQTSQPDSSTQVVIDSFSLWTIIREVWEDQDRANTEVQYFQVFATIWRKPRKVNETKWQMHLTRCDANQFSQEYYALQLWKSYGFSVSRSTKTFEPKSWKDEYKMVIWLYSLCVKVISNR